MDVGGRDNTWRTKDTVLLTSQLAKTREQAQNIRIGSKSKVRYSRDRLASIDNR